MRGSCSIPAQPFAQEADGETTPLLPLARGTGLTEVDDEEDAEADTGDDAERLGSAAGETPGRGLMGEGGDEPRNVDEEEPDPLLHTDSSEGPA